MEEEKAKMTFNISGGNVQILPNATEAVQNFNYYGLSDAVTHCTPGTPKAAAATDLTAPTAPDHSSRFAIYINNVETRERYISQLKNCQSAAEVGRTVVAMVQEVPGLTFETAKTEPFISILLCLATSVTKGITIENFRKAITNAWCARKD
ncbi:MAG: hypothetical protein UDK36_11640 [Bacteroidaceae bacterium]|nr:hypothetical protein [Bacteroidaceae bacterium]